MKIAVPLEQSPDEPRAAIGPDAVKAYIKKGHAVTIEAGLGKGSFIPDQAFKEAGATIARTAASTVGEADVVLTVGRPSEAVVKALKPGAVVIGLMDPHGDMAGLEALRQPRPASSPWSSCHASAAPSRWTCCRARPISPATRRSSTPPSISPAPSL
jgi:NAD(P) transhydrogenase subunit alpha